MWGDADGRRNRCGSTASHSHEIAFKRISYCCDTTPIRPPINCRVMCIQLGTIQHLLISKTTNHSHHVYVLVRSVKNSQTRQKTLPCPVS